MAKRLLEAPDPWDSRRAELARLADAYEAVGRGLGPHFVALAEGLAAWGPVFDHRGIRYTRVPGGDFVRARIHRCDTLHEPLGRPSVGGRPRRGKVHAFRGSAE